MAKRQPPRRLFKKQDHISAYVSGTSPTKLMKRVSRDHEDVLQNIEFVLVSAYRGPASLDDRAASEALRACLGGPEPADPRAIDVVDRLKAIRELREDVTDAVWRDALRVVDDSVRRHSDRVPGAVDYLEFAAHYLPG